MANSGLQQRSSVPLYRQLKDKILSEISSGKLAEGAKIPTEVEFSDRYAISRITVRNAIKELVEEGYLIKKQGKGTFVCRPKIERKVVHLLSFTDACKANHLPVQSRVIRCEILSDYRHVRQLLDLKNEDSLLYIQRLRMAGDAPLMLENNYYSLNRFGFLQQEDLRGSLYQLLREKYAIVPTYAGETTVDMVRAHDDNASLLQQPPGEPLFLLKTLILDNHQQPIHYGEQFIVAERYTFSF
ncbi:UTRA domain-containing protein [Salmonella enterica subsp. enterica]|nr:GntR family transcriptional regulator [Salmonella enterica]EBF8126920.1 GntR family transcriptional regulator [Salmonella enterica subsp. enterica]EBY5128274.1 GntR family transcriptional regulator [Salmonella enterica subsp. enterica serovar Brazzaville]EEE2001802.1 GntR family transcriptional regulator [Salmonella enterica subsp. enterica serovar Kotte]EGZ4335617.1 GntR family transcriptional regulator [Salmonella enterica subsp. enterica serovar Texas]